MSRAKERRIILPDTLPSSERRPGPAERKLPSYLQLSAALKDKQLISEWNISNSDATAELQLREALTRTLSEHVHFGYIRQSSKLPQSHPKPRSRYVLSTESGSSDFLRPNGTDWLGSTTAPSSGNWSVIPKEGSLLYIFDFDVAKEKVLATGEIVDTDLEERFLEASQGIATMEKFLGISLRATYAQLSPSGGVHIFVLLPVGTDPNDLPSAKFTDGMRSLAGIPRDRWQTELKGDIRSGGSNGFILMAGSQLEQGHYRPLVSDPRWQGFKDYRSGRKLRLLTLPESAVQRLRDARSLDLELRGKKKQPKIAVPADGTLAEATVREPLGAKELRIENYSRLLKRLESESPRSFHESRAQIYRALSCCGSVESIADICREAGYGRDSHRGRELTDRELIADIEAMDSRGLRSTRCGAHCRSAGNPSAEAAPRSDELEALIHELILAKLAGLEGSSEIDHGRLEASSTIEARSLLKRRSQRDGDFGIYGKRNPLGLDYRTLTVELIGAESFKRMLRGENLKVAGYRLRALELAVGYFGPLFAAGASMAIAPAAELMELFGWTASQVREAMRLLRKSGVISLERRQISGKTSCYGPGQKRFYDGKLSRKLRSTWGASMVESGEERAFLGGSFDYSRGRIVRPDGSSYSDSSLREIGGGFSSLLQELNIELPRAQAVGKSVVTRYLGKSLARYLRISNSLEQAVETVRELSGEQRFSDSSMGFGSFIHNLPAIETSSETSRKDRPSRDPHAILFHRIEHSQHGDRSPPDDLEGPRTTEPIAKRIRKTIDAT